MKALILGASGQDGHYLAETCRRHGVTPIGCSRSEGPWIVADVSRFADVEALVEEHRPAYIFHLAANSTTRHDAIFDNHAAISTGTINVLEAARRHVPDTRVFLTGSGVQFVNRGLPISEKDEFEPSSPYSVARIHSVYCGRYFRRLGLRVFVGYLFHHESPMRKPGHVSKLIAQAALRHSQGDRSMLELGDIEVEKEWAFAGDVAEGIFTLVGQDSVFEATIGTGEVHSIQDWLEACYGCFGLDWRGHVRTKEGFVPEYRRLVSDPTTIQSLGWSPSVGLSELARMMTRDARPGSPAEG